MAFSLKESAKNHHENTKLYFFTTLFYLFSLTG